MKHIHTFENFLNEASAPLFPDVLKIKKDIKITSNANNERDVLPAGVYKSTGKEFDGMHIYKSKGKNWFLWPEDMDVINDMNEAFRPAADEKLIDKMKIRDGWELNVVEVSEDTEHIVITGEYATSTTDGDTVWIPKDQWNEFKKMINGINV